MLVLVAAERELVYRYRTEPLGDLVELELLRNLRLLDLFRLGTLFDVLFDSTARALAHPLLMGVRVDYERISPLM